MQQLTNYNNWKVLHKKSLLTCDLQFIQTFTRRSLESTKLDRRHKSVAPNCLLLDWAFSNDFCRFSDDLISYSALFCTVLYYAVLYSRLLFWIVLWLAVLSCTVLYYIVLYFTVLYCTVPYCTVQHCTVTTVLYRT